MIRVRSFSADGLEAFSKYIAGDDQERLPKELAMDEALTYGFADREIDPARVFGTRYDLGAYLVTVFDGISVDALLRSESDPMWAWINAIYFDQLARNKIRRKDNYIPVRNGAAGSVLHRNASRTAFELVHAHGTNAKFALQQQVDVRGQLLESLTASQDIVRNKGFFAAAASMYVDRDGKVKRGANAKPIPRAVRKAGEESGKGSIRRLPLALRRLNLTYDVDALTTLELVELLPKEFGHWTKPQKHGAKLG